MNKVRMALGGAAMYLGACAPMTDYERTRCDINKDRVTELVSGNGTQTPFDDRVIRILLTEENHEECKQDSGDNDGNLDSDTGGNTGGGNDEV